MTQVATMMRDAFAKAILTQPWPQQSHPHVSSALRRKVGLVTRKTMWSVHRGKR